MSEKVITAIVKYPGEPAEVRELSNELSVFQRIVGGYIETYPSMYDKVIIVCNEEGKIRGLSLNFYSAGEPIVGPIIFVRADGEDFASLRKYQVDALLEGYGELEAEE